MADGFGGTGACSATGSGAASFFGFFGENCLEEGTGSAATEGVAGSFCAGEMASLTAAGAAGFALKKDARVLMACTTVGTTARCELAKSCEWGVAGGTDLCRNNG